MYLARKCTSRTWTTVVRSLSTEPIPVIKLPKYLETNLGNSIYKEHVKRKSRNKQRQENLNAEHSNKLIISSSKDKSLNHYYGFRYNPENMSLISKNWLKSSSNGERMTFHNYANNPSVLTGNSQEGNTFESLELDPRIIESIYKLVGNGASSAVTPSAIQLGVIPFILQGENLIFSAETGSGKTIAYLAPVIQLIAEQKKLSASLKRRKQPLGLVLLPSRELTEQVGNVAQALASNTEVGVSIMIGGIPKHLTATGFDLIISTVGLVENHINKGVYSLRKLNHIVLDEADTLLDDSFSFEVMDLLERINIKHKADEVEMNDDDGITGGTQLICCSATIPSAIDSTIGSLLDLSQDVEQISTQNLHFLHPNIKHIFYRLDKCEKDLKLIELVKQDRRKSGSTIIFANRTNCVNWIYRFLTENGIECQRLSGELIEEERINCVNQFQSGEFQFLATTDLGSRGLDTTRVKHVINFDCPHYVSDYIHRSGRTGRLGTGGGGCLVSTMVTYKPDVYMLMQLEKSLRLGKQIDSVNANIKSQLKQIRADKRAKIQQNFSMKYPD